MLGSGVGMGRDPPHIFWVTRPIACGWEADRWPGCVDA